MPSCPLVGQTRGCLCPPSSSWTRGSHFCLTTCPLPVSPPECPKVSTGFSSSVRSSSLCLTVTRSGTVDLRQSISLVEYFVIDSFKNSSTCRSPGHTLHCYDRIQKTLDRLVTRDKLVYIQLDTQHQKRVKSYRMLPSSLNV